MRINYKVVYYYETGHLYFMKILYIFCSLNNQQEYNIESTKKFRLNKLFKTLFRSHLSRDISDY